MIAAAGACIKRGRWSIAAKVEQANDVTLHGAPLGRGRDGRKLLSFKAYPINKLASVPESVSELPIHASDRD
jgi:hypothetical protein